MMAQSEKTGTRDSTYDLVSVLYHALEAAHTCLQYREDAQREDQELASFFDEVISSNRDLADRAKALLSARLGEQRGAGRGQEAEISPDIAPH